MNQNGLVNQEYLSFGSVLVEISEDNETWLNAGWGEKAKLTEKLDTSEIKGDNCGGYTILMPKASSAEFDFTMYEFNWKTIASMRGGLDTVTAIAGTAVTGESQTVKAGGWNYNKFILLGHQNFDGSALVVSSVTAATDGVLTANTDYYIGQNASGDYGIFIIDSAKVTTIAQNLTIVYNYTPATALEFVSGGKNSIESRYLRLTNTDDQGKILQITFFRAYVSDGISIDFPSDADGTQWKLNMKWKCYPDTTRKVGAQLYKIHTDRIIA
jgi:hypothetical protein